MDRNTITFRRLLTVIAALTLLLAACGNDDSDDGVASDPDDGVGAEPGDGVVDPGEPAPGDDPGAPGEEDDFPLDEAREEARGLLGMFETDLDDDVRIARRGEEMYALTMDHVPGRLTVELDDDGSGYRVVLVNLEVPEGSETFELQGG